MSKKNFDVPVLMYHSIGIPNKKWNWNYLTCPFNRFEEQLQAISELGYSTISLNKLYDYMVEGKDIPNKSIVLTFDDGYADIWVYAYPLLKKYGMCGTVFINPDFVDRRNIKRKLYSDQVNISELDDSGFLSWEEIITMDQEGVIYSESHALTHTWYPNSSKIIDFRHPNDNYTWMTWNKYPELKPNLQIDDGSLISLGIPVYKSEKSLSSSRYFPDKNLDVYMEEFVKNNGGMKFFDQKDWKDLLFEQVEVYKKDNKLKDKFENEEDYKQRIHYELKYTKDLLEERLDRDITFLCWPGGSATEAGMKIAKDLCYQFFNTARDMSVDQRSRIENIKYGGIRVKRFTPFLYWDGQENIASHTIYANKLWMKLRLIRYSNKYLSKYWFKAVLLFVNGYYKTFSKSEKEQLIN